MSKMNEITEQIRACANDSMRVTLEADDAKVLLAYLESHGYLSTEGIAALEAQASENSGAYYTFLQSKGLMIDTAPNVAGNDDEHAAHRAEYVRWLASEDGVKAVDADAKAAATRSAQESESDAANEGSTMEGRDK